MINTFARALALVVLAGVIGGVHSTRRDNPIRLTSTAAKPAADRTATQGESARPGGSVFVPAPDQDPGADPAPDPDSDAAPPAGSPANPATDPASDPDAAPTTTPDADPATSGDPLDAPVRDGHITLREASELWQFGAVFLDARHEHEFEEGHVQGAYWMAASRVGTAASLDILAALDPNEPLVIYCTGGDCDASENTRNRVEALGLGFIDIRILGVGYEEWEAAGLPVTTDGG